MKHHLYRYRPVFASPMVALLATALVLCAMLAPSAAWADTNDQVAELLTQAEEDYDMLMWEEAEDALQEGIAIIERENLRTVEAASIYVLLGIIRHGDGEDSLAEDAFVNAIETNEDVEVGSMYSTPALEELMQNAAARAEPPPIEEEEEPDPQVAEPSQEDTEDEDVEPLRHSPLRRANADEPLVFVADMPAHLPVFRVHVHHRRYGESDFVESEMDPTDATGFALTLPEEYISSSQIEYFITAVSRSGDIIAESGRSTNPHRISLIGGSGGDSNIADTGSDDDLDTDDPSVPGTTGFYGSLAGGTDIGFLPGGTAPTANEDRSVSPGFAPAFAHTRIDLGWRFTEENSAGIYFRWQFSPAQDFNQLPEDRFDADSGPLQGECLGSGIPGDCLVGVKYERLISTGFPQFYSSVGFGFGRVRNWLELKQATSDEEGEIDPACVGRDIHNDPNAGAYCKLRDTVRTGWVHFGVGGGMYFPVHDNFDIVTDAYLMVHVPDTSVNIDFNLGVRFRM